MNPEQERRNSSRVQLNRLASLDFTTAAYEGCQVQNLSLTGMFVHGDFQQNEGDHCTVNIVQEGKHSYLSMKASTQIVRKDDNGIAIVFTSMPLESLMLLQMILHCEEEEKSFSRGIKSFDNLPFKVQNDLLT